jgi:hypothetical protein
MGERAEAGEGRLQQVEPDEAGEPEPKWADGCSQDGGDQHKGAGDRKDDTFDTHQMNLRETA